MLTTALTTHAVNAAATVQAAGIFDWVDEKTSAAQKTVAGVLILAGLIVGLVIAWRGKSVGSVLMGIVVGGLIAALPFLISFFGDRVQGETTPAAAAHVITYAHAALTARV